MALPLWGQLEKATDDEQTIDEAIAEAIAAHESDPEAHLGEDESLEKHKTEEIIDHPQGSILPDKWSFADYDFETNFENLTPFTISSGVTNTTWPGATFDIFDGGGDVRTLRANLLGILTGSTVTYNYLCDVYFSIDSADDLEIINIGITNTGQDTHYLGIRISGGDLFGVARWGGSENLTANLGDVSDGGIKFVRLYYDEAANTIYFYLDGVLVASMTPASAIQISNQWGIRADDNGAEGTVLRVYKTFIARSI